MKTLLTPLIAIGLLFGVIAYGTSAQMDVTASEATVLLSGHSANGVELWVEYIDGCNCESLDPCAIVDCEVLSG